MRVLIVDDEAPARERLKCLLTEIGGVEIAGEAENGPQAVVLIESACPDLVLLDIQMPGLDGFGVIEALEVAPPVVFVTAYDEHAIRAFEVAALDYLLKPVSRQRLEQAIHRVRERQTGRGASAAQHAPLLESLAAQGRYLSRLAVLNRDTVRVLDARDMDWIGVENEQTVVYVGRESFRIRRTLSDLSMRLDPACFFRAHRSAIVNLDRVREIVPWFKESCKLRLSTGAEVDLSRAQARALRKILRW